MDTRHSDCCDGRPIPRIFAATQDAENGLPSIPQNMQEPRVWDATISNSSYNFDVAMVDLEPGMPQNDNPSLTRPSPLVTQDPSANIHPRMANTTQRPSTSSLNVRGL